jgi:rod shape determining protein RodA
MSRNYNTISKGFDWTLIWIYIILVIVGIMMIFANEYKDGQNIFEPILKQNADYGKQILWAGVCAFLAIFILLTDSKFFTATANLLYAFGLLLCILAIVAGTEVKGSNSWLVLGGFRLQPSELTKVFTALALGKFISRPETNFSSKKAQLIAAAIALTPAFITILQNETGLALVYFAFFIVMYREGLPPFILIAGASIGALLILSLIFPPKSLLIAFSVLAALVILLTRRLFKRQRFLLPLVLLCWGFAIGVSVVAVPYVMDNVMKPYQVDRIYSMVGKQYSPKDPVKKAEVERKRAENKGKNVSEYNVIQSKIAIGSGGLTGKGYLKGTQTRYDFVPEQRTDFIFCTIGEGFGFLGSLLFLGIFAFLLLRIVMVAERQRSTFSRVYAYGVASIIFIHLLINVCMTIGLAPVIGIPLPLISYGGSSLLTFTMLIFILVRLDADRQMVLR